MAQMIKAGLRARLAVLSALVMLFCKAGEKLVSHQKLAWAYPESLDWMWVR